MSDLMFYGVLRMPYEMAMSDSLSRFQFYGRAQEAADRVEAAENRIAELERCLLQAQNASIDLAKQLAAPAPPDLLRRLLADHQRIEPHHADMCALCKEAQAAIDGAPVAAQEPDGWVTKELLFPSLHRKPHRVLYLRENPNDVAGIEHLRTYTYDGKQAYEIQSFYFATQPAPAAIDGQPQGVGQ